MSDRVVSYRVVNEIYLNDLIREVNRLIMFEGWKPLGGIFWTASGFLQAMVKEETSKP